MRHRSDPFDDGGTPAWRQRQAAIIDADPPLSRPVAYARALFRRTSLARLCLLILSIFFVLPWAIFIGGIVIMATLGINPS